MLFNTVVFVLPVFPLRNGFLFRMMKTLTGVA